MPHPSGWIFSYGAQNLSAAPATYTTTPAWPTAAQGGGIWQGGAGLASGTDPNGGTYIYFSTADGTFDLANSQTPNQDAGNSFIKLTMDLKTVAAYFTPSDQFYRSCADFDFGSGGVTLIPDNTITDKPFLAVEADKEGGIWVMDRGNPGGYNSGRCSTSGSCTGLPPCSRSDQANGNLQTVWASANGVSAHFHTAPAYWNRNLYYASTNPSGGTIPLTLYPIATQSNQCPGGSAGPICPGVVLSSVVFPFGATPSVSSNGVNAGIVWAIRNDGLPTGGTPATLEALDAVTMKELYNSDQCSTADQPGPGAKFSVPTVANGYVYVGTQTNLAIYGPVTRACP
jgi:hypothetical protein